MINEYLTTSQAAKLCNVTRFTIRNWINSGKLKARKTAGGHRRISKEAFLKFINGDETGAIQERDPGHLPKEKRNLEEMKKEMASGIGSHPANGKQAAYRIPRCWEFHFKSQSTHNCINCLAFKERANKCFLLLREFGSERVQCQYECLGCEYLKKYYPAKEKIMKKIESDAMQDIQDMIHKRHKEKDDVSAFFKKGLFASGKYLASIKKVVSRKQKIRSI